jgi:hypothetical protein
MIDDGGDSMVIGARSVPLKSQFELKSAALQGHQIV